MYYYTVSCGSSVLMVECVDLTGCSSIQPSCSVCPSVQKSRPTCWLWSTVPW